MKKIVACDTETTGLSPYGTFEELGHYPARPFAFSFTHYDGKDFYVRFPVDPFTRRVMYEEDSASFDLLRGFFSDASITKIFHNAAFDLVMLDFAGLSVAGNFLDTRILAHLADSSRPTFELKPLTKTIFDFPDDDETDLQQSTVEARRKGKIEGWKIATKKTHGKNPVKADYWLADPELCKKYAVGDTQRTMKLFKFYEPLLELPFPYFKENPDCPYESYKALVEMEHALVPIAMEMSREGATLDMAKVEELEAYYRDCMEKAQQARIDAGYGDLNPKSPQQVIEVFYNQLGAEKQYKSRKDKRSGKRSKTLTVDKKVLAGLSDKVPLAQHLLEYSEAQKQLTGFILPFKENSFLENGNRVIHPSYNTVGPITGRMSCNNPNLQNITSPDSAGKLTNIEFRVRECFAPPEDFFWILSDYGQIEIYCTAYLSGDRVMIDALESGKKLHDITCVEVIRGVPNAPDWEAKRKKAKITNFLLQYRGGAGQLAQTLGIPYEEALTITKRFSETYQGLDDFYKRLEKEYQKNGFVKSLFGRPFKVTFAKDSYKLGNYVSQGTAAEIIKHAMVDVHGWLRKEFPSTKLILQVHDELIFRVPKSLLHYDQREDLKALVQGIESRMKGNFHELLGMPGPLVVESSIAVENWGKKEKAEKWIGG